MTAHSRPPGQRLLPVRCVGLIFDGVFCKHHFVFFSTILFASVSMVMFRASMRCAAGAAGAAGLFLDKSCTADQLRCQNSRCTGLRTVRVRRLALRSPLSMTECLQPETIDSRCETIISVRRAHGVKLVWITFSLSGRGAGRFVESTRGLVSGAGRWRGSVLTAGVLAFSSSMVSYPLVSSGRIRRAGQFACVVISPRGRALVRQMLSRTVPLKK